jgi:hypothetical protein
MADLLWEPEPEPDSPAAPVKKKPSTKKKASTASTKKKVKKDAGQAGEPSTGEKKAVKKKKTRTNPAVAKKAADADANSGPSVVADELRQYLFLLD